MRKTKIVCTLGPAVTNLDTIREMVAAGMNCARLNFSHGDYDEHLERVKMLKIAREEQGKFVALMMDTKGPEIRTKAFTAGYVDLKRDDPFTLYCDDTPPSPRGIGITYPNLCREITVGTRVLLDDGLIELLVTEIFGEEIRCSVLNGGMLGNNKSINLPGCNIDLPSLTAKDKADIAFAVEHGFDFVAASFVRKVEDVLAIRETLDACGGESVHIISKIENREGVDNAHAIIAVSDGIMVARGDLGVEIPAEEVPGIQKMLIAKCVSAGKPVITATQMLDSMTHNPRPTRAEVSDVANAVFDGSSCVMLSGETAAGKYPLEAVRTMLRIVCEAESAGQYAYVPACTAGDCMSISDAISQAACQTAKNLEANAILTVTTSGHSARMIARFRPECPIIAVSPNQKVKRQLGITWGVKPCAGSDMEHSSDKLFDLGVETARAAGLVKSGDLVVTVAGFPIGESGTTNQIRVQKA